MIVKLRFSTPEGQKIVEKLFAKTPTATEKQKIAETYKNRRGWTLVSCDTVGSGTKKKSGE